MSFDKLIHDLKVLVSTWDKKSKHKKCQETFIKYKCCANKRKIGDDKKTSNFKKNKLEVYIPFLPSTYVKGKRTPIPKPITISGELNNNEIKVQTSEIVIINLEAYQSIVLVDE